MQDPDDLADALARAQVFPTTRREVAQPNRDGAMLEPPIEFPLPNPRRPLYDIYTQSHTHCFARLGLLVTAFLHTRQNVSFRSCAIILALLNSIFLAVGIVSFEDQIPTSLDSPAP